MGGTQNLLNQPYEYLEVATVIQLRSSGAMGFQFDFPLFFRTNHARRKVDIIAIISHLPGMGSLSFDGYPVGLIHPWRRQRHFTTWLSLPCPL